MTKVDAPERVPDWLLGGQVRRRVIERLASARGSSAAELAREIDAGEATVYEVMRALRGIDALEAVSPGRYRLAKASRVAKALRSLVNASREFTESPVSRPPGRVKSQ